MTSMQIMTIQLHPASEEATLNLLISQSLPMRLKPQVPECNAFRSDTGQAPWDDETPGPPYSNLEQIRAPASTALDTSESSDERSANVMGLQMSLPANVEVNDDRRDSFDNCVVDCVKPLAERTPELV